MTATRSRAGYLTDRWWGDDRPEGWRGTTTLGGVEGRGVGGWVWARGGYGGVHGKYAIALAALW
jgi:hypothetical protein